MELSEEDSQKINASLKDFGPIVLTSMNLLPLETYIKAQLIVTK